VSARGVAHPDLGAAGQCLIRELCSVKADQGLSYSDLARLTNYSRASWERWLNGKRLITSGALRSLAAALALDAAPWLGLLDQAGAPSPGDACLPDATPSANSVRPPPVAQLPPDTPGFAGRRDEAHALAGMLTSPDDHDSGGIPALVVLSGGGGLGKTALATRVAHTVAARFPDGQLFADLRGGDSRHACAAEVLAGWLAALGEVPDTIPRTVADRSARFRTLLRQRRMLLFLDDAAAAEDVQPLVPASSGCAVLVTSRSRLDGLPGACRVELAPLPDHDAMQVLERQVGACRLAAEPQAGREVVAACSGLPLALRIAGARLVSRPAWPVGELARRLADREHLLDELQAGELSVRACLAVSYSALVSGTARGADPAKTARAFRLLGLVPLPRIPAHAAAVLTGLQPREADDVLEQLVDSHLLESPAPGQYRMHDLVRRYAAERSLLEDPEPVRTEAIGRLLLWYLCSLPLEPAPAHDHFQGALELVRMSGDTRSQAAALNHIGTVQLAQGHHEAALRTLLTAQSLKTDAGPENGMTLLNLGRALGHLGRYPEAIGVLRRADRRHREQGDQYLVASNYEVLGTVHMQAGNHAEAEAALRKSIELRKSIGYQRGAGIALTELGDLYQRTARPALAARCWHEALTIFTDIGYRAGIDQMTIRLDEQMSA
jgi:tetratricopeptide (TPR) repeat protein